MLYSNEHMFLTNSSSFPIHIYYYKILYYWITHAHTHTQWLCHSITLTHPSIHNMCTSYRILIHSITNPILNTVIHSFMFNIPLHMHICYLFIHSLTHSFIQQCLLIHTMHSLIHPSTYHKQDQERSKHQKKSHIQHQTFRSLPALLSPSAAPASPVL